MAETTMRRATEADIAAIARVNAEVFLGDRDSPESAREWIGGWYRAFPNYQYFVAETDGRVIGYAGWFAHGGWRRAEPVFELDQIGFPKEERGHGVGQFLIHTGMRELVDWTIQRNDRIESHVTFVVWAYAFNFNAINAYAKQFSDGVQGFRTQFGTRAENMLRMRYPVIRPVREED